MPEKPDPIVDVGIPAYGRPRYLVEAIESVLAQTLTSWRLLISEDGPGGGPVREAVEPYLGDPRIGYMATGRRLGAPGNSTKLIQAGSAPYVHLLHDDDVLEGGFLERHVQFLEDHPACGLVFSSFAQIDEQGREIERSPFPMREGMYSVEEFFPLMLRSNQMSTDNVVVRRTAYEAVGAECDSSFPWCYDWEMWLRLTARFPVGYLAVCDTWWRRHGEQISFTRPKGEEYHRLLEHIDALLERERPDLRLSPGLQRRKRSSALLTGAIDALEQNDRARAWACLKRALGCHPPYLLDPRAIGAVIGLALGNPGRRAVLRCRRFVHGRGKRLVYRPYPSDSAGLLL